MSLNAFTAFMLKNIYETTNITISRGRSHITLLTTLQVAEYQCTAGAVRADKAEWLQAHMVWEVLPSPKCFRCRAVQNFSFQGVIKIHWLRYCHSRIPKTHTEKDRS